MKRIPTNRALKTRYFDYIVGQIQNAPIDYDSGLSFEFYKYTFRLKVRLKVPHYYLGKSDGKYANAKGDIVVCKNHILNVREGTEFILEILEDNHIIISRSSRYKKTIVNAVKRYLKGEFHL